MPPGFCDFPWPSYPYPAGDRASWGILRKFPRPQPGPLLKRSPLGPQAPAPQSPGGAGEAQATLNRRSPWMPSRPPAAIIFPLAPSMLARSLQGKIPHSPGIPCVGPSGCPRFFLDRVCRRGVIDFFFHCLLSLSAFLIIIKLWIKKVS